MWQIFQTTLFNIWHHLKSKVLNSEAVGFDVLKEVLSPVEAQVPLADQVCGVASLVEPLGQSVQV